MKRLFYLMMIALALSSTAWAQQTTITGVVTGDDNKPIPGATVVAKGAPNIGAVTDENGKYTIMVPAGVTTLVFTFIGMEKKEVAINGSTSLNVQMNKETTEVNEVVVTAIGVPKEKRSLGYNTTTVNTDELNEAVPTSPLDALQGKVAGAEITNVSGTPGGSTKVVLRGGSSITGDNNALIVVDGVPIDNSNFQSGDNMNNGYDAGNRANDINPEDIESVTVLNGASAVALYGQRGANGAILYTTKSGKDVVKSGSKFKVSVSENAEIQTPLKLPTEQNQFGQGDEDVFGNAFFDNTQNWSWGPAYNNQPHYWGTPIVNPITGVETIRVKPYSAEPNNINEYFNLGSTFNTNVAISGGDSATTYYTSFNNVKYNGIIPNTGYQRNSARVNVSHDFGKQLTVSAKLDYVNTNSILPNNSQGNEGIMYDILQTPRDIPVNEIKDLTNPFNVPTQFYNIYAINPFYAEQNEQTKDNVDRFMGNVQMDYKPTSWLTFTNRFGADIYTDTREQDFAQYSYYPIYFYGGGLYPYPYATEYIGKFDQDILRLQNFNNDLMARFAKDFKHDVSFSFLLGNNIYSNSLQETYGETAGLALPTYYNFINSLGRPTLYNDLSNNRLLGLYGDATIGYKNFLYFDLTARNDWSSTLPVNNRSYFYPGASVSWVFTDMPKEKKMNPMGLSYGKLRASIAQIGRDAPPYSLSNFFVPGDISDGFINTDIKNPYYSPVSSNVPGYQLNGTLADSTLKPEISTTWEAGFDLGFLNDRLLVNATYYYKNTVNEIQTVPIAPSTGYVAEIINAGVFRNQGVELSFHAIPVKTKDFKWEIFGTWAKNISDVVSLANGAKQLTLTGSTTVAVVAQVGQPYQAFYGTGVQTQQVGIDKNGNVVASNSPLAVKQEIATVVDSSNGVPQEAKNASVLGDFQAKWEGSIGTSLSYKGFSVYVLFGGRSGGQFYSETAELEQFTGNGIETATNNRVPSVVPNSVYMGSDGQYHTNTTPVTAFNYWYNVSQIPSYQIIPADFIKLRNISVSYAIPAKKLKRTKAITGVTVRIYGDNLWIWTPKSNPYVDPELSSTGTGNGQGYEFFVAPSVRNGGFGATIDFGKTQK